jgi:hydrogenase expression/formation protein HypC
MCLSSAGKIIKIDKTSAMVDLGGIAKEVSAAMAPKAKKGDYVLIHAGFILQVLDKKQAKKILDDINETKNI